MAGNGNLRRAELPPRCDAHFKTVNTIVKRARKSRRYEFRFLPPKDYDSFFETLREGKLDSYVSTLQGQLDAKK